MRTVGKIAAALAMVSALGSVAQASSRAVRTPPPVTGTWLNPRGTVAVNAGDCSGKLCGWVSWASPVALADAAAADIPHLIGTELLQNYRPAGPNRWAGRVYVPDMGRSFQSTIEQIDPQHLKISGCILGGLFCKSQIWRRS
ncbi:MAG TPA: DUF2147 domain-containing protein [Sphingobium sp.]